MTVWSRDIDNRPPTNHHQESARDKHYEYCSSDGHVKVKMPTEKEI